MSGRDTGQRRQDFVIGRITTSVESTLIKVLRLYVDRRM